MTSSTYDFSKSGPPTICLELDAENERISSQDKPENELVICCFLFQHVKTTPIPNQQLEFVYKGALGIQHSVFFFHFSHSRRSPRSASYLFSFYDYFSTTFVSFPYISRSSASFFVFVFSLQHIPLPVSLLRGRSSEQNAFISLHRLSFKRNCFTSFPVHFCKEVARVPLFNFIIINFCAEKSFLTQ